MHARQFALVPEGEVYGGNPAAPVRKLSKEEIDHHKHSAEMTAVLAAKHVGGVPAGGTDDQQREKLEVEAGSHRAGRAVSMTASLAYGTPARGHSTSWHAASDAREVGELRARRRPP